LHPQAVEHARHTTDRHALRGILVQLALRYLIPVFDTGVRIDSEGGSIRSIIGRVTTLQAGEACLFCRGRTSPDMIRIEALTPGERQALIDEAYAPRSSPLRPRSSRSRPPSDLRPSWS
jgi:hypothetical protein